MLEYITQRTGPLPRPSVDTPIVIFRLPIDSSRLKDSTLYRILEWSNVTLETDHDIVAMSSPYVTTQQYIDFLNKLTDDIQQVCFYCDCSVLAPILWDRLRSQADVGYPRVFGRSTELGTWTTKHAVYTIDLYHAVDNPTEDLPEQNRSKRLSYKFRGLIVKFNRVGFKDLVTGEIR